MADIDDLLDYAYQKNYAKADAVFNDLIGTKLGNALDQEKIKVAGQVYNDMEEKDFEVDDEEQLTLASDEEEAEEEVVDSNEEEPDVEEDQEFDPVEEEEVA